MEQNKSLHLQVTNSKCLQAGSMPSQSFTEQGGVIGSSPTAYWILKDRKNNISNRHCEILVQDGCFCIKDLCGETYINGSTLSVGKGNVVLLRDKDTFTIGIYHVASVLLSTGSMLDANPIVSLDQEFNKNTDLISGSCYANEADIADRDNDPVDPLVLIGKNLSQREDNLLDGDNQYPEVELNHKEWRDLSADDEPEFVEKPTLQTNSDFEISSAMKLKNLIPGRFPTFLANKLKKTGSDKSRYAADTKKPSGLSGENCDLVDKPEMTNRNIKEGQMMDEETIDLLEAQFGTKTQHNNHQPSEMNSEPNHMLSGPLFRGLGASVGDTNSANMQMVTEEIGATLQATIKGLLDLHLQVEATRYRLINKNLQPIEDNPLRLGLSYQDTVETMFNLTPDTVYLSAPSAVEESLTNLKDHNEVVSLATSYALRQIVQAFSPEVLLKRFERYRRTYQGKELDQNAWAWDMYQSYYQELISDRQNGFEKLFWEIFEQDYDRLLREKQKGNSL